MKVAFIGLGVMGFPMAGYQQAAGLDVTVYNRTTAKAQKWAEQYGGQFASTPAAAVKGADVVMICVGNDDDVRSVVYGDDGIINGLTKGALIVDHTTTSHQLALELNEQCEAAGLGFWGWQAGRIGGPMVNTDISLLTVTFKSVIEVELLTEVLIHIF